MAEWKYKKLKEKNMMSFYNYLQNYFHNKDTYMVHKFTEYNIKKYVDEFTIGNYRLGNKDVNENPIYIGRSDTNLQSRLLQHLRDRNKYDFFSFKIASSKKDAYIQECKDFHNFYKSIENKIHPDKPDKINNINCPVKNCSY